MIEFGPVHDMPSRSVMTALAGLIEFPPVNILVAAVTSLMLDSGETQIVGIVRHRIGRNQWMAFVASHVRVLSRKWKSAPIVIEARLFPPAVEIVAFATIGRKLSSVFVHMTSKTLP
jgi:hypothetical protein